MKVLMIDGPWRGQVHDVPGNSRRFQYVDYGAVSDDLPASAPVGTYFVCKYMLAGRVLLLGTTQFEPSGQLADDVFWDLLASDAAKDVSQRVPAVWGTSGEGGQP